MKNIEYLVGSKEIVNTPLSIFSKEACCFCYELSRELLKNPKAKKFPDIQSFGFWCRKANIEKLKEKYGNKNIRVGKGLVFHITPSNVPINFAFSYIFSLLAGNANIVRVASKNYEQITILCELIRKVLMKHSIIAERTAFIRYAIDNSITAEFSLIADARVIWGGDATIKEVRLLPTKARCIDVVFSDRYSIAIVGGEKLLQVTNQELKTLARNFYNDTFLMDQNACASPQIVLFKNASEKAKDIFWESIYYYAKEHYQLQPASAVDKFEKSCKDAIQMENVKFIKRYENFVYRIVIDNLKGLEACALRGSCGYFYEYSMNDYDELLKVINEKYQTITYFDIDTEELLKELITNRSRGVDRLAPVGQAMDIGTVWDGYDIIGMLSRIIDAS